MSRNKKRLVSALLVLVMVTAMLPSAFAVSTSDFKDVKPNGWYINAINYAVTKGLFEGTSGTTFEPDATMTKGMFVTVLSRMAGADTTNVPSAGLTDISGSEWYAGPANWAAGNGYAIRNENNRFRPDEPIAREEIADILTNYLTKTNTDTGTPTETVDAFADAASVSDWAVSAVEFMRSTGLMTGDENLNFNPQQYLTRAEAATVFMRIGERIGFEGKADDLFGWVEFKNNGYYEFVEGNTLELSDYLTDEATEYYRNSVRNPVYVEDYPGYENSPVKPHYKYWIIYPNGYIDKTAYNVEQHLEFKLVYQLSLPDFNGKGEYIGSHEKNIESRSYPVTIVVRKDNSGSEGGGENGGGNSGEEYNIPTDLSEEAVRNAILALKETYPQGTKWTNDNYYYSSGMDAGGWGCHAFALLCSDAAFGDLPLSEQHTDISRIRVGDIIRIKEDTHSVVVLEVNEDNIVVVEGNNGGTVQWGRIIRMHTLERSVTYILTRYPE